ncbi:transcriptional repressor LexA [bacterium]|nr:transcriptional repressor LexA [bacterium]
MKSLTKRQQDILKFITQTNQEHGYPPTLREICKKFKIASTNGARYHLMRLHELGYLDVEPNKSRGMRIVNQEEENSPFKLGFQLPVLGRVPAGPFNYASPDLREDEMTIDPSFFGSNIKEPNLFGLRVSGDSMIEAGIMDRDVVIVRPQETANTGDIIVARLDDEATVKRFRRKGRQVILQPENPSYEPIPVSSKEGSDFAILGLVVGLIRTM